jgi:4-hydroxy-4-methyl-2-oxoglutarate aldolase
VEHVLSSGQLEAIRRLGTCAASNAIESFNVRLRNEGFADSRIKSMFPHLPPMLGYAVTARIRCSSPPPVGHTYHESTAWLNYLITVPAPRVVVIQDIDPKPGFGAFVGEVHASIQRALGSVGAVTNGAARDLQAVEASGYQLFARNVAVSHAYAHMVEFGVPVEVGGLRMAPGDLIFGDSHGVMTVPVEIAAEIPQRAETLAHREQKVIDLCKSRSFSVEKLREVILDLE